MLSIICFIPLVSFITTYFGGNMCLYYNRFFNVWTYVVSAYYTLMKHQKKKKWNYRVRLMAPYISKSGALLNL